MSTKKLLEELAETVVKVAQDKAPVVTGELKSSIAVLEISDNEAIVGHTNIDRLVVTHNYEHIIYPIFVHEGTAPHIIEPKTKKALAWNRGGNTYIRKKAYHPGAKAQPYFDEAINSPEVDRVMSDYGDDTVKDLALQIEKSWGKQT